MKTKGKLNSFEILSYGIGGLCVNLASLVDQFGMYYLTNIAVIPSGAIAYIMLSTTILDAINDPIIGNFTDRFDTKFGKYRPFMLIGGFFMIITLVLRFSCPPISVTGKIVYFFIVILLYTIAFSCCAIPWQTMMSVISFDYNDRNFLFTARSMSGALVPAVLGIIVLPSVSYFGGGEKGWSAFVACMGIIGFAALVICQYGLRKRDCKGINPAKKPQRYLYRNMIRILRSKPVAFISIAIAVSTMVQTMGGVCQMHYYEYVLDDISILSAISAVSLPISIICIFLIPFILKKITKKQMLIAGFCISLIKPIVISVMGTEITREVVIVMILISRIGISFFGSALFTWIPECIDYTTWKTGISQAALISATVTFFQQCGRALGQWLSAVCLETSGFNASDISKDAVKEIININGSYLIIGFCIAVIPIIFFPVSKKQGDQIRNMLIKESTNHN